MSVPSTSCRQADSVGAYVLGALPGVDARTFARHLEDCSLCREDVERLRAPVELLYAGVPSAAPPPSLRRNVMATVQREAADRRRHQAEAQTPRRGRRRGGALVSVRTTLAAASGAAVAVAAVAAGLVGTGGHSGGTAARTQAHLIGQVVALPRGASGQLVLNGEQATLKVRGLPEPPHGRIYEVWLQRAGVAPEATDALFTTSGDGRADVGVPGSLTGVRRVLVTSEPRGGSVVPTRQPVIVATL